MLSFKIFINEKAKILVVFLISLGFCFWIISDNKALLNNIFSIALLTGFLHQLTINIVGKFFSKLPDDKKYKSFLEPSQNYSAGKLLLTILQFLVLMMILPLSHWNVENTILLISSFLAGSTFSHLVSEKFIKANTYKFHSFKLDGERYEAFIATIISCVILGSGFLQLSNLDENGNALNGLVLLPIIYALINTCISYLFFCVHESKSQNSTNFVIIVGIISAVFHFYLIEKLIVILLPESFIFHGIEYNRLSIQLALQYGLIAGLFAGLMVKLYYFMTDKYIAYLLAQQNSNTLLNTLGRLFINGIIYLLPAISVFLVLWHSFQLIGLYGIAISFLGMLSNVGMKLFIQQDRLEFKNTVRGLSQIQLLKLNLISPDIFTFINQVKQSTFLNIRKSSSR